MLKKSVLLPCTANLTDILPVDQMKIALGAKDLDSGHQMAFHASSGVSVASWA